MDISFDEKRVITSLNIDVKPGQFALDQVPFQFENCRERFAKMFVEDTIGFYFKHKSGQSRNVAHFILKTESILQEIIFSKFAETNRDSILWFEPSRFWKMCPMRRSLLTILVRCGMLYDSEKDNYEEALFAQEYVVPTKKAVMRFLFGFTDYAGPSLWTDASIQVRGWKTIFDSRSNESVRESLLWPKDKPPAIVSTEFLSALWT